MANILHVLNGDSVLSSFNDTGLEGDVMVWREVFSEGPLLTNIVDAQFWEQRRDWIGANFGESADDYQHKVIDELGKLSSVYTEINLWFEFDLHCQINLLGLLNYIQERGDLSEPALYLICPGYYPGIDHFMGMGQLNARQLEHLYDEVRVQLNEVDFYIAGEVWKLYTQNNFGGLQHFINTNSYWANMTLLKPALEAHLKRSAVNEQGLTYIEQKLLDIYQSGITERNALYEAFWRSEKIYGMGDMEIAIYLGRLEDKQLINNL